MDWHAHADLYCERVGPDFWAEPVNALSNLAFLAAAGWGLWLIRQRRRGADVVDVLLIVLVALVGVGSFLWHSVAERWAELADAAPIWIFVGVYVYGIVYEIRDNSPGRKARIAAIIGVVVAAILYFMVLGESAEVNHHDPLNGSGQYAPALIALLVYAGLSWRQDHPRKRAILAAALVFAVSLVFRSIDPRICALFPLGTHFLWHGLNGLLCAILIDVRMRPTAR